jgi:hypothetical protein
MRGIYADDLKRLDDYARGAARYLKRLDDYARAQRDT